MLKKVFFSHLSLGAKFKYKESDSSTYVKIDVLLSETCVALWNENEVDTNWIGQPVFCFNEEGKDQEVFLIK